jgi:hypothetical protein
MKRKIINHIFKQKKGLKQGPIPAYLFIACGLMIFSYNYNEFGNLESGILVPIGILFLISFSHILTVQRILHNITFLNHIKQMEFQKIKIEGSFLFSIDKEFLEKVWGSLDNSFFGAGYGYELFYSQFNLPNNRAYYYDESVEFICHIDEKQSFKFLGHLEFATQDVKYINGHNYFVPQKSISFWLWRNAPDSIFFSMFLWFRKKLPILYLGKESKTGEHIIITEYELSLFEI